MRPDRAASGLGKVVDCLNQSRLRRIGVNVEDENLARIKTGAPELAPIVREPGVVRFVASIDGGSAD
ncbi:MAG: hypothetical protein WBY84_12515, partial [Pseudolabrys sp.]